jgi:hypothetical protein
MKKVSMRTKATDKSKVASINKSKPGVGGFSYSKNITPKQDKAYNSKQM